MTDKELKRLNRAELLQLLLEQTQENERLKQTVAELNEKLEQHKITCDKSGTLAEAALAINHVFEAADKAAQKYMQELQERTRVQTEQAELIVTEAREQADVLLKESRERANAIVADAETQAQKAREEAEVCVAKAKTESEEYWKKVNGQIQTLIQGHEMLKALLQSVGRK